MKYKAIIFDLDGVVVTTDEYHYLAWKKLADEIGVYFDKKINNRLRGVSRMESLDIVLEKSDKTYTPDEKIDMAQTKNAYYVEMIKSMDESAIIDGAIDFIKKAKEKGIKTAIASSSKNAKLILEKTNLTNLFDAIADGCDIKNSKPAPDVFLVGAKKLDINPCDCLVIEDAKAGVKAGIKAGMEVLAVGDAQNENDAIYSYNSLKEAIEILAE